MIRHFTPTIIAASFLFGAACAQAVTTVYKLDLGVTGSPLTAGFTAVNAPSQWTLIPTLSLNNISGEGSSDTINITFNNFQAGNFNQPADPLLTDGFYVSTNVGWSSSSTFTISNLSAGSSVNLYAIGMNWNSMSTVGSVTFGGTTATANVVGTPGTNPTIANFTYIGTAVAGAGGDLSGSLNVNPTRMNEGDLGGLYIEVTSVPEPSTWAMIVGGTGFLVFGQRMRRKINA